MSFDCSRFSFDSNNDFLGVVRQQGRVTLDSEENELQQQFARRIQAGTLDTLGRAVYPPTTPIAFKIKSSSAGGVNTIEIGAGRMYVDGLLVENHGILPPAFTVVATDNMDNPTSYGVQITTDSDPALFTLALYQVTTGGQTEIGQVAGQTISSISDTVSGDPTLGTLIRIEDAAPTGIPAGQDALYMLAAVGSGFQADVPSLSSVQWDPALAELSGAPQVPAPAEVYIDFAQQPYPSGLSVPQGSGPYLFYLDVWKRPVTYLQRPDLVEKAVGVDTTGRIQIVWQVKYLDLSGLGSVDCGTDLSLWDALLAPPAGRLTNGVVQSAAAGPCCLTPNTGYTGQENQLYRVEIHRAGSAITASAGPIPLPLPSPPPFATFKWSRDNASVATSVLAVASTTNPDTQQPTSMLSVASLGRDEVLGFNRGDWIEVTDDVQELQGQAGELHRIELVDPSARTITLDFPLSTSFPLVNGQLDPSRHTRIRRWDQGGKVYQSDGSTIWVDLDSPDSTGEIPVPPPGTTLILENGLTVTFGLSTGGGSFRIGDFWAFAARAADGSVESLVQAPPLGIHHHYARLAVVTFPGTTSDCRVPWRPGCSCCCTVTLRPEDVTGSNTLQDVVNRYRGADTPTVICLMPGEYLLSEPLLLGSRHHRLTLKGCQQSAVLKADPAVHAARFREGLLVLNQADQVTLDGLALRPPACPLLAAFESNAPLLQQVMIGLRLHDSKDATVNNCRLETAPQAESRVFGVGILAGGDCSGLTVQGSHFVGTQTVLSAARRRGPVLAGFMMVSSLTSAGGTTKPSFAAGGPPLTLASAATLDRATFRQNSFWGLTVAALSAAYSGTVRFRDNRATNCFGGLLLYALGSPRLAQTSGSASARTTNLAGVQSPSQSVPLVSDAVGVYQELAQDAAQQPVLEALAQAYSLASAYPVPAAPALMSRLGTLDLHPQFHIANNQLDALPAEGTPSAFALRLWVSNTDPTGADQLSSILVSANELRGRWQHPVVDINGAMSTSVTGNLILNQVAAPDATQKLPLSLGIFLPAGGMMAATGNVLNCRSSLGLALRNDIQPFDNTPGSPLAQLNTWKFLNFEPAFPT